MKVYALIKRCEDNFYPDYTIVDDCVYLNEVDAKKRLEELIKENPHWPEQFGIYDFKVRKPEELHNCLNCSASMSDDDENGNMILRCAEHDWKIVDEDYCCDEWN